MKNQYVKARYTFVNSDGLVIPKNAIGIIRDGYYQDTRHGREYYDRKVIFYVDGDFISCSTNGFAYSEEINETYLEQCVKDLFKGEY